MPIYKTELQSRQEIAAGTMAFHFEKPEGFAYKAGQFADYTLINPPETDAEGNTRGFSLASAPYEGDLMLATRMRDTAFTRVLRTMELSTEHYTGRSLWLLHAPQQHANPHRLSYGRHRRDARQEHRSSSCSRQCSAPDCCL
jgi:ferredoxin-NADP reductase